MNRINILIISIIFLFFILLSCSGPERDAKNYLKRTQEFTLIIKEAIKDSIISDNEVEQLKKDIANFEEFQNNFDMKYENDSISSAKIENYFSDNKAEVEKIFFDFWESMTILSTCSGSEKLE